MEQLDDWSFEETDWISPGSLRLGGRRVPGIMPRIGVTLHVVDVAGIIAVDAGDHRVGARRPPAVPTQSAHRERNRSQSLEARGGG